MTELIPDARRKELFLRLVELQDDGLSVTHSRQKIAEEFHLTEEDVRSIEREGIAHQWPPL